MVIFDGFWHENGLQNGYFWSFFRHFWWFLTWKWAPKGLFLDDFSLFWRSKPKQKIAKNDDFWPPGGASGGSKSSIFDPKPNSNTNKWENGHFLAIFSKIPGPPPGEPVILVGNSNTNLTWRAKKWGGGGSPPRGGGGPRGGPGGGLGGSRGGLERLQEGLWGPQEGLWGAQEGLWGAQRGSWTATRRIMRARRTILGSKIVILAKIPLFWRFLTPKSTFGPQKPAQTPFLDD